MARITGTNGQTMLYEHYTIKTGSGIPAPLVPLLQDTITISGYLGLRISPCSWFRTMISLVHVSNGYVGGTVRIQNLYML
jgi:hypothetical protein